MHTYPSVHVACQGILAEAVEIARTREHRFAVGGWPTLSHGLGEGWGINLRALRG